MLTDETFRQKIVYAIDKALGRYYRGHLGVGREYPRTNKLWTTLRNNLVEDLGLASLATNARDDRDEILGFIMTCDDERLYYFLDYVVQYLNGTVRQFQRHFRPNYEEVDLRSVDDTFERLNDVFLSHGLPLRIVDGSLVDSDRELPSIQIESPAFRMLDNDRRFSSAASELQEAIIALRQADGAADAIRLASHALESTIDVIGRELDWNMPKRQLSKQLQVVRAKGLFTERESVGLNDHFTRLIEILVAAPRDVTPGAGHGAGASSLADDPHAEFVVDVACAAVKALYNAFRRYKP
jgi:AbiJ-like protein